MRNCAWAQLRDNAEQALLSINALASNACPKHSNILILTNRIVIPTLHMKLFSTTYVHVFTLCRWYPQPSVSCNVSQGIIFGISERLRTRMRPGHDSLINLSTYMLRTPTLSHLLRRSSSKRASKATQTPLFVSSSGHHSPSLSSEKYFKHPDHFLL